MRMRIRLSPVAQRDILDITDYYTELSRRLGERFTEELTSTLRSLTRQPGMGSQRYAHLLPDRSLRMWQLDHFPYLLFYRARDETFSLLRVLHERRALSADSLSY
ncbi:hypothetical protein CEJ45_05260 [Herbaspirillum aquaticum]|uniref:Plasmid stabilization protein n=2 Tax=Herbaspirillum aquaticum TaxID=568783 RepID=A0A225SXU9_9BURK|nr:hypothetical protein CEJ45_05260 [Herbaspirillum aquaticum]